MDFEAVERRRMADLRREIDPDELTTILCRARESLSRIDTYPMDAVDSDYLHTAKMRVEQALDCLARQSEAVG